MQARWQTSTCVISRAGAGEPVFDPNTGTYANPASVTIYDGPCMVVPTGGARVVEFGEGPVTLNTYDVVLTGTNEVDVVNVGDRVAVSSTADPTIDSATLTVLEAIKSDLVTNRRIICEGS